MNTSSVARLFFKTSYEDAYWLNVQPISVSILWREAAMADPWGEKWQSLETDLAGSTFRAAKKKIEEYGAFAFRIKHKSNDRRRTEEWEVLNLRGSKNDSYWQIPAKNSAEKLAQTTAPAISNLAAENSAPNSYVHAENSAPIAENSACISSETLSLIDSCPSLRSNIDHDLDLTNAKEKIQDFSSTERSGRLELDSSAKATESAPSPDAEITREETRSFAIEEDPWAEPTPLVDHQNSRNCEERLVGMNEEKDIATAPKDDGSVETNITPPISRTFRAENRPEAAPTSPPVESSTEPPKPVTKPHVATTENVSGEVYREARRKYQDRGLNFRYSDQNWSAFEKALCQGKLATIAEGFQANKVVLPPQWVEDLMSDYLFYPEGKGFTEPQVCIRDNSELKLVPWSHLPAIVGKSVPEVRKVQSR